MASLTPAGAAPASSSFDEACGTEAPTPVEVPISSVPIVVSSTEDDYFALYVRHDLDFDTTVDVPVAVTRGEAGSTTLAERVPALPADRYKVEKYLIADPADVDGDCIDDMTELADPASMNPVNAAAAVPLGDGAVAVPDRATFEALAVSSNLKFIVFDVDTDRPRIYFINVKTHSSHVGFTYAIGVDLNEDALIGVLAYDPDLVASSGSQGVYYYYHGGSHEFHVEERVHTLLAASLPLIEENLALYARDQQLPAYQHSLPLLRESRIPLLFTANVSSGKPFLALNPGEGYGRLRRLDAECGHDCRGRGPLRGLASHRDADAGARPLGQHGHTSR